MSDAAASAPLPRPPAWTRLREAGTPLLALLRRDLLASRRGNATLWARLMAGLVAGAAILLAFGFGSRIGSNSVGRGGAFAIFAGLVVVAFLLAPAVAIASLRREREAQMLDLLFLAGIRPRLLALGRILSTFLFFESLLFAALPALALFWFYRRPSLPDLLLATAALTTHFLALAAVAVAISAWSRNAGYALALAVIGLGGWAGWLVWGLDHVRTSLLAVLAGATLGEALSGLNGAPLTLSEHARCSANHLVVALAGWAVAMAGLARRQVAASRDLLAERLQRRPLALGARWPLTWLLQRGSAPARPIVQALVVLPFAVAASLVMPEVRVIIGAGLIALGLLAAAAVGATSVAAEREHRSWTSLLSTAMPGADILVDLVRAALLASAIPALTGLALTIWGLDALGALGGVPGELPVVILAVAMSWCLAAVVGVACSIVARTTAGALTLAAAWLAGEPLLALGVNAIVDDLGDTPMDGSATANWAALLFAAALGGAWLALRAGWDRFPRLLAAFVPALIVGVLPLVWTVLQPRHALLALPVVGTAAGLAFAIHGMRRLRGVLLMAGLLLLASCFVVPLVIMSGETNEDVLVVAAFGGSGWPFLALASVIGAGEVDAGPLALGLAHHGLLGAAIGGCLMARLERWMGRAG